ASPRRSSRGYGNPLACSTVPSTTRPQAPISASQGLTRLRGSGSMGRAPSFSSRVQQSCTLLKRRCFASLKSRSVNNFHNAMPPRQTQGCSIRLSHPMKRVNKARGMRLVSRKLMSSCWTNRAIRDRAVISVSFACNTVRASRPNEGTAISTIILYALGAVALAVVLQKIRTRLQLSRAKHRSLTGHSRMARRFASLVPFYEYGESRFFDVDGAPESVASERRAGFMRLAAVFAERFKKTAERTAEIAGSVSDLQFTSPYRVPFQFSGFVRRHFKSGNFLESSSGVTVTDLDGNRLYDLTGSYGVNVFGYDFYKECIDRGAEMVRNLGPVLGAYHPVTAYNVRRLLQISGLDEVSFHMSGTEAVMQAVRVGRYHTRRAHLVRFCGAYHGWWGDVQPGVGNPLAARETYTLEDMDERSLKVLRSRRDIACVLVNPLQAMHPNANAPGDSALIDSGRSAHFDREGFRAWLEKLRAVCSERRIVLIFDEVFVGFRLARGGAQEYFGVRADMVTYGKTVAGGL